MKHIILFLFIFIFSTKCYAIEREKGITFNKNLVFKTSLISERDNIPADNDSSILLDYTAKIGDDVYVCTQNRSQASSRGEELENVTAKITKPIQGGLYFLNTQRNDFFISLIVGSIDIVANVSGDNTSEVSNVSFYLNDDLLIDIPYNSCVFILIVSN